MGKLIKYEFKGRQKRVLGTFVALVLFNIYLLTRISSWSEGALLAFLALEFATVFILIVSEGVSSMSRELYSDTGYLLFTLPQKGYAILAAKLISVLGEFIIASAVAVGGAYVVLVNIFSQEIVWQLVVNFRNIIVFSALAMIALFVVIIILAGFSLVSGRIAIRRRKGGKLISFIIFVALIWGINWLDTLVMWLAPYTVSLNIMPINYQSGNFSMNLPAIELNIASTITQLLIYIGLFAASAYLIDRKLDV